jgi:hypothetical protein
LLIQAADNIGLTYPTLYSMRDTTISFVIHEIAVQGNLDFGRISVVFYRHMKSNGVERKVDKDHERFRLP